MSDCTVRALTPVLSVRWHTESWLGGVESVDLVVKFLSVLCWIFSAKYYKYNSFMKTDGNSDGIEDDSNAADFG